MSDELQIAMEPPVGHRNQALVNGLTEMINSAYRDGETRLWVRESTRVSSEEVSDLLAAGEIAVARRGREVIGCVRVHDVADDIAEFGLLAAAHAARGERIGAALVDFTETQSRARGLSTMQLELLVPRDWRHSYKEFLKEWYVRLGYALVRKDELGERYPQLVPMLATDADLLIFQKPLTAGN